MTVTLDQITATCAVVALLISVLTFFLKVGGEKDRRFDKSEKYLMEELDRRTITLRDAMDNFAEECRRADERQDVQYQRLDQKIEDFKKFIHDFNETFGREFVRRAEFDLMKESVRGASDDIDALQLHIYGGRGKGQS